MEGDGWDWSSIGNDFPIPVGARNKWFTLWDLGLRRSLLQAFVKDCWRAVERRREIPPYRIETPVTYEIDFKATNQALMTTTLPTVEQIGPKTIRFTMSDPVTAYKHMWGCVIIAMSATNGVLGHVNA